MIMEFSINADVCTECMMCTEHCPTGAFYYQDGFHLDSLVCCNDEVCSDVCPEQCLEVRRVD